MLTYNHTLHTDVIRLQLKTNVGHGSDVARFYKGTNECSEILAPTCLTTPAGRLTGDALQVGLIPNPPTTLTQTHNHRLLHGLCTTSTTLTPPVTMN